MALVSILAGALQRAGVSLATDDLADILWLASWLHEKTTPPPPEPIILPGLPLADGAPAAGTIAPRARTPEKLEARPKPVEKVALHAGLSARPMASGGAMGAMAVRSPAGWALPGTLVLGRRLRPLARRIPSTHRFEVDEVASADAVAQTRLWLPILRPVPVRAFDLALVVDSSESMVVWRDTAQELRLLFERIGAFRTIRLWLLTAGENMPPQLQRTPHGERLPPETLVTGGSRQVVLVVTDCIAPAWRRAALWQILAEWSLHHSVALLQLMPQRLWSMNGLAEVEFTRVTNAQQRPVPTAQLTCLSPLPVEKARRRGLVPIPVTTLEPEHLGRWAMLTAGRGDAWLPAAIFDPDRRTPPLREVDKARGEEKPEALVRRFQATASPFARRLLSLLAAAPLSLSVMRLIQRALLPDSRQSHLAEVFVSGLLRHRTGAMILELEAVGYDFLSGVRDVLLDAALVEDSLAVQERVSRFVEQRYGQGIDFRAFVPSAISPGEEAGRVLEPFAEVSAHVFRRLGFDQVQTMTTTDGSEAKVNQQPTPKKWVLVAGTGEFQLGTEQEAAELIGQALAEAGYGLVTGGWRGVDHVAARAFYETTQRLGWDADHWLKQAQPFGRPPDYRNRQTGQPFGKLLPMLPDDNGTRTALAAADAGILIGGRGGTMGSGQQLRAEGKPVLPLAATGGGAATFFEEVLATWAMHPIDGITQTDFLRLAGPLPQAAEIALALLEEALAAEEQRSKWAPLTTQTLSGQGEGMGHRSALPRRKGRPFARGKARLAGRYGVGKTSLGKRLVDKESAWGVDIGQGINIADWTIKTSGGEVGLHLWDFGGQEVVHSTHLLFFTERSLYLVVVTENESSQDAEHWLRTIESFAASSPVILVLNKIDEQRFDLDRRALLERFPNIAAFVETDRRTGRGIQELQAAIAQAVELLPQLCAPFPPHWLDIKAQLAHRREAFLSISQFRDLCSQNREPDPAHQEQLLKQLHDLGAVVHFGDDFRLQDFVILKPQWLTEGIYKILRAPTVAERAEILVFQALSTVLPASDYPPATYLFLLQLMQKFELCLALDDRAGRYLVPDLLPLASPPSLLKEFDPQECLNLEYHYDLLPLGVIPQFIVKVHTLTHERVRWRHGVVLEFERNTALVQADPSNLKVVIRVNGAPRGRRRLLTVIRAQFQAIHSTLSRVQVKEMIPVPGHPETLIDALELLAYEHAGIDSLPRLIDGKVVDLSISQLLEGLEVVK